MNKEQPSLTRHPRLPLALPETELDFEAVFNSLPTPLLVMDRDFTIVALNQAFLDATARSRDELIGINILHRISLGGRNPPYRARLP